jgi:hypothetical protein
VADAVEPNPTFARRVLAVRLHDLREQYGRDLLWLAQTLPVALSQASRLDTGARGFRPTQVEILCREYGLPATQAAELMALAKEAQRRAWWQQVDLGNSYRTLIGLERAATEISEFCSNVIPGLLQVPEYSRAAVKLSGLNIADSVVQRAVDVRRRRQEILLGHTPPDLEVVIDEATLARGPDEDAMRSQLKHLLRVSEWPKVRIQVVPFERGLYPTGDGHYILLRLPTVPDIYYSESLLGASDTDGLEPVTEARSLWKTVQGMALSTPASRELIDNYLRRL